MIPTQEVNFSSLRSLEKRINKKVMAMFEKAEDEYNDLMSKKNIIEVGNLIFLITVRP